MTSRSTTLSKLLTDQSSRRDYIRAKMNQIIPSQIRALRLQEPWTQKEMAEKAEMKQARISAIESPGEVNFSLETLIRVAAAHNVGLWVEFISHAEMVRRENRFSMDTFHVTPLDKDVAFCSPNPEVVVPTHTQSVIVTQEMNTNDLHVPFAGVFSTPIQRNLTLQNESSVSELKGFIQGTVAMKIPVPTQYKEVA